MNTLADWKLRTKLFVTVIAVILLLAGALTAYSIITDIRKGNFKSYVDIAY